VRVRTGSQSEVAIGMLDKCIFAVFSLYVDNYLMIEPDDIKTLLGGTCVTQFMSCTRSHVLSLSRDAAALLALPYAWLSPAAGAAYSLPDGMHVIPWGFDYMRLNLSDEKVLEVRATHDRASLHTLSDVGI
jgi:hypothetical protein